MQHLLTTQSIPLHEDCLLLLPHLAESSRVDNEDGFNEEAEFSITWIALGIEQGSHEVISPHEVTFPHNDDDRFSMVSIKYLPR